MRRAVVIMPIITIIAAVIARIVTRAAFTLLFLPRFLATTEIGEYAEIMVGKLQMIFRIHAVTVELRILCQLFIFFQHLRCVAARPVINLVLIVKTVAIVILLPVVVIVATAPTIVVLLLPVVDIHQG